MSRYNEAERESRLSSYTIEEVDNMHRYSAGSILSNSTNQIKDGFENNFNDYSAEMGGMNSKDGDRFYSSENDDKFEIEPKEERSVASRVLTGLGILLITLFVCKY
jgi:hypothetical protein